MALSLVPSIGGGDTDSKYWNFTDQTKDGFSLQLVGTLTKIYQDYKVYEGALNTKKNGRPYDVFHFDITTDDGNVVQWNSVMSGGFKQDANKQWQFVFSEAGKALAAACQQLGVSFDNLDALGGMRLAITTEDYPVVNGRVVKYNNQMPRPWTVQVLGQGQYPFQGIEDLREQTMKKYGPKQQQQPQQQAQPAQYQQPMQYQQAQPMQYQQPMAQHMGVTGTSPAMMQQVTQFREQQLRTNAAPQQPMAQPQAMNVGGIQFQEVQQPAQAQSPFEAPDPDLVPYGDEDCPF